MGLSTDFGLWSSLKTISIASHIVNKHDLQARFSCRLSSPSEAMKASLWLTSITMLTIAILGFATTQHTTTTSQDPAQTASSSAVSPAFLLIDPTFDARYIREKALWVVMNRDRGISTIDAWHRGDGLPSPAELQQRGLPPGTPLVVDRILEPEILIAFVDLAFRRMTSQMNSEHEDIQGYVNHANRVLSFIRKDPSDEELFQVLNDVHNNALGMAARMQNFKELAIRTAFDSFNISSITRQEALAICEVLRREKLGWQSSIRKVMLRLSNAVGAIDHRGQVFYAFMERVMRQRIDLAISMILFGRREPDDWFGAGFGSRGYGEFLG